MREGLRSMADGCNHNRDNRVCVRDAQLLALATGCEKTMAARGSTTTDGQSTHEVRDPQQRATCCHCNAPL